MKFKKTKTAALALATVLAAGSLSGCAFVTTNIQKDLSQVVAEVNIMKKQDAFAKEFGENIQDGLQIETSYIYKRDLVAAYASYGSTYVNSYGYTAEQAYDLIKDNLINRAIYLQYAQAYFLNKGSITDVDKNGKPNDRECNIKGYRDYISDEVAKGTDPEVAKIAYFLSEPEREQAKYNLKTTFNSTLDSLEAQYIEAEDEEHDHDAARTTPTGVDATNEDYYDPQYKIYTATGTPQSADSAFSATATGCGTYEAPEGSTLSTRRKAYKSLLSNLYYYGLISKGEEDTSDITKLSYYAEERVSQYETVLINKISEVFREQAKTKVEEDWIKDDRFQQTFDKQKEDFADSESEVNDALDGASDESFVLWAPANWGYVINILLPFDALQTQALTDALADPGDVKGNKFVTRASLLAQITATDQRGTWFTGHEDYSYVPEDKKMYTNNDAGRQYLFFENNRVKSAGDNAQYEPIPNYYGEYSYNGTVVSEEGAGAHGNNKYTLKPNKIDINGFLGEMEGYLEYAGFTVTVDTPASPAYFTKPLEDYYKGNDVNGGVEYSSFLYYKAHINELKSSFDANNLFKQGSNENKAFSVINELSFAYNTDTAGLNSYLGYVVTPNKTEYVNEFEWAAQEAVRGGAGTITVAPPDYGWHIMYCTFKYDGGENSPFTFDMNDIYTEGTFSYLYYQALTSSSFSSYSSELETTALTRYNDEEAGSVKVYLDRYKDLFED